MSRPWNGAALGGAPGFNGGSITAALSSSATITTTTSDNPGIYATASQIRSDLSGVAFNAPNGGILLGGALDHDGTTVGFYGVTPTTRSTGWTITNDVTDRTFDANANSTLELADVVATLIRDLAATGIIGAVS